MRKNFKDFSKLFKDRGNLDHLLKLTLMTSIMLHGRTLYLASNRTIHLNNDCVTIRSLLGHSGHYYVTTWTLLIMSLPDEKYFLSGLFQGTLLTCAQIVHTISTHLQEHSYSELIFPPFPKGHIQHPPPTTNRPALSLFSILTFSIILPLIIIISLRDASSRPAVRNRNIVNVN